MSACTNGLNACAAPPPHCLTAKFILLLIRLNSSCMKPPGSGTERSRRRESMSEVLSRGSSSEEGYYFQRSMLVSQIWSGFPRKFCTSAHDSGQVLTFRGKSCPGFGAFTRSTGDLLGKLAEGSDKLAPSIGSWAQDLDKKHFLRLGSLRERKFQGKKPKSFVHLLLEK